MAIYDGSDPRMQQGGNRNQLRPPGQMGSRPMFGGMSNERNMPMFGGMSSGRNAPMFGGGSGMMGGRGPGGGHGQQRGGGTWQTPPWNDPANLIPYTDKEKREWWRQHGYTVMGQSLPQVITGEDEPTLADLGKAGVNYVKNKWAAWLDQAKGPQVMAVIPDDDDHWMPEDWPWGGTHHGDWPHIPGRYWYEDPQGPALQPWGPQTP